MRGDRLLISIKTEAPVNWTTPSNWDWVNSKITDLPDEGLLVIETEFSQEVDTFTADAFVKHGGTE